MIVPVVMQDSAHRTRSRTFILFWPDRTDRCAHDSDFSRWANRGLRRAQTQCVIAWNLDKYADHLVAIGHPKNDTLEHATHAVWFG